MPIIAQTYLRKNTPENTPKVPRKCHVSPSGWMYIPLMYSLCDVAGTAQGEAAEPYIHDPHVTDV